MGVRSEARGTPAGSFMGVDGHGKSFAIMTIDVRTVEGASSSPPTTSKTGRVASAS